MDVADVAGSKDIPDIRRLTLQNLGTPDELLDTWIRIYTTDVRHPADVSTWPPPLILDFFYGCVALKAWGPKSFTKFIQDLNSHDYYESAEAKSGESGHGGNENEEENIPQHNLERRARYEERQKRRGEGEPKDDQEEHGQDEFGEVMDVVMTLWMRHAPKRQSEQDTPRVPEVDHSKQKVQTWLESS